MFMNSRRDFFKVAGGAALSAWATSPFLAWPAERNSGLVVPGKDDLIVRSYRFTDLETPVEYFNTWLTPVPHFFVRNHMHPPSAVGADGWALSFGGEVDNPYSISLAELSKLEKHSVVNTLECAGNGRGLYHPQVPGVQWGKGAVGNARFAGPRLRDLLQRAGVKSGGEHVMFRGLDEVPGNVPPFIRSIPIEKALDEDTLVALEMNGAALTRHHGYPARTLVPGWIGAASCKWLTEIKVLDKEFVGNFMSPGYRMPNQPVKPGDAVKPEDTHPVTALNVKSLIAAPADDSHVRSRTVHVQGVTWGGEAEIAGVDVSMDGGSTWHPAQLGHDKARYAWRVWTYKWKAPKNGDYTVMSRATDNRGTTQPMTAVWNPSGYLNNAIDQVKIHVEA
jgi:DMSO/TMAO reductase YedYZ molybdopterin-dependent catalytic subunit